MTHGKQALMSICMLFAVSWFAVYPSSADDLSNKQQLMNQLQAESNQTTAGITKDQQSSQAIQNKISNYQNLIDNFNQQIATNEAQLQAAQQQLDALNQQIQQNQSQLNTDQQNVANLLRAMYEQGSVPYIEVMMNSTSWDDFLTRFQAMGTVTKAERAMLQKVSDLHKTLAAQQIARQAAYQSLHDKTVTLTALRQVNQSMQLQQKDALNQVKQRIQAATGKQIQLKNQMKLTQSQIVQLEQQVAETAAVLSTGSTGVKEPDLQYKDIQPQYLLNYVEKRDSTFSLQDIETICQAAKSYNVNPALLVAITGQEQAFVPPGPDAALIRNNPFNVFYSWQVYNTNLADASNIAANTVRHKLSTPPPNGEDAILWMNDPKNPWGIYAEDPNWAYGVRSLFNSIMASLPQG